MDVDDATPDEGTAAPDEETPQPANGAEPSGASALSPPILGPDPGGATAPDMRIDVPDRRDAAALAAVHVQSWREAYGHLLPERFYDEAVRKRRERGWAASLQRADVRERVRVAWVDGEVVGFALVGKAAPAEQEHARDLQLSAIYVLATHYGSGAGQALLDAVLGDRPAQLWVARDNPRARAFYARNGCRPDGAEQTDPDLEDLPEIRMVR